MKYLPLFIMMAFFGCAKQVQVKTVQVDRPNYSYQCNEKTGECLVWIRSGRIEAAKEELCTTQYICSIAPNGTIYIIVRTRK